MKILPIVTTLLITAVCAVAGTATNTESVSPCGEKRVDKTWYYTYSECKNQSTQISALSNVATENVSGSQVSLVSNIALGDLEDFQLTSGYNHVGGTIRGYQLFAFANYAKRVEGGQIFGTINSAQYVEGIQIGNVNVVDTIVGGQIGMLNIADHIDGYSFALLTIADNGLFHVDYSADESGMNRLTFASGKTLFTSYSIGYTFDSETNPYSLGMGVGYHKEMGRVYTEVEMHGSLIMDKHTVLTRKDDDWDRNDWRHNSLGQIKARIGMQLLNKVGLFGGVTYNGLWTHGNGALTAPWTDEYTQDHDDVHHWPGFEIGIRIGQ
ncbi:MAG: hypothetical protein OCC49_02870 [Fibrobacterales bacterium]